MVHGLIENLAEVRLIHMALLEGRAVRLVDPEGFLSGELSAYPELFSLEPDLDRALPAPVPRCMWAVGSGTGPRSGSGYDPEPGGRHGLS